MQLVQCVECGDPIGWPAYLPWPVVDELGIDDDDAAPWWYQRHHEDHEPVPDPEWVPRCDYLCCVFDR